MDYLDSEKFIAVQFKTEVFELIIKPLEYLDGRHPRLPRKNSKKYSLGKDVAFYFQKVFSEITTISDHSKYKVSILVNSGKDRLGNADLDNYCKAILDGITATKKVWNDDKQVDKLKVTRVYSEDISSSIILTIAKIP